MANARPTLPVPAVDKDLMRQAASQVFAWIDAGEPEPGDEETIPGNDLRLLLLGLERDLGVNAATAVALFKRSLALSAYCSDAEPAEHLFEDGLPGRELCAAAATATVLDDPGMGEGEMGHKFDGDEMRAALLSARN